MEIYIYMEMKKSEMIEKGKADIYNYEIMFSL